MVFGSLFSGIESASVAWAPLRWRAAWLAEIEPFPSAVLAHRYPQAPNLGDVTAVDWRSHAGSVDLIVGGSPCQSFSIAGKRLGLEDPRGNLALVMLGIVGRVRPQWVVFENVPGLLSSDHGRDFGTFLGLLGQLGYGFAYRVLDAQYFGVPQRRRRVFVVGHLGDWRPAAAVLFERESLSRHRAPGRGPGPGVANCLTSGATNSGRRLDPTSDNLIAHTLRGGGFDASEDGTGRGTPLIAQPILEAGKRCGSKADPRDGLGVGQAGAPMFTLQAGAQHGVAVSIRGREGGATVELSGEVMPAMRASQGGGDKPHVLDSLTVRRLTPLECERLQGFPDHYTLIPWRGKPAEACPDGPRYKALGNSMAVPVIRWIGERIQKDKAS